MNQLLQRKAVRPVLLVGVPIAVLLAAALFWLWGGRYITTENAYVKADIAQISAEIAGRVLEVHVRDHAEVKTGDLLVSIDPEPFRVALAKAEAELDATRGQVRTLIATWNEALSELQEAESKVAYWNTQMARQKTLTCARHRGVEQIRGGRKQRHGGRGPGGRHAQEGGARCRPARQQSGAAGGRAPAGAREAGRARAGRNSTWHAR